jgi:aldehyde:ferredoxin oxidoreductase
VEVVKKTQDYYPMIDSSGICSIALTAFDNTNVLLNLLEPSTGIDFSGLQRFLITSERIFILEKMFNLKAGVTEKDDSLP